MSARGYMRPMPGDFAAVAWSMSGKALEDHFKAGQVVIARWRKELGADPRGPFKGNPAPADFAKVAATMTAAGLSRHYDVGHRVIARWLKETGASVAKPVRDMQPMPADFKRLAPTMYRYQLSEHYGVGYVMMSRWLKEAGVEPKPFDSAENARRALVFRGHAKMPVHRDLRKHTMFDEAADILRRERFVVYRCGPTGVFLEKGLHWRVGNVVCTPDDLLRRADKYRSKAA